MADLYKPKQHLKIFPNLKGISLRLGYSSFVEKKMCRTRVDINLLRCSTKETLCDPACPCQTQCLMPERTQMHENKQMFSLQVTLCSLFAERKENNAALHLRYRQSV